MWQQFLLDRRGWASYLAISLAACQPRLGPLTPSGAAPLAPEQVAAWVAATTPEANRLYRFKWRFQDGQGSAGGRGSARVAAPDSLRFDVAGPFGAGASSAVVIGDSARWAEPPDAVEKLVPEYPLMWAIFGVARRPSPGAELRGLVTDRVTHWAYINGGEIVEYARTSGAKPKFTAQIRRDGRIVGRTVTTLSADGQPLSARLTVPSAPAQLDITFTSSTAASAFAPETWRPRQP